jgi:hypothetical protein
MDPCYIRRNIQTNVVAYVYPNALSGFNVIVRELHGEKMLFIEHTNTYEQAIFVANKIGKSVLYA